MGYSYRVCTKMVDSTCDPPESLYYAVPVHGEEVDLDMLCEDIEAASSLTAGDVKASVMALTSRLATYLMEGHSVRIDGLGLFTLAATSDGYTKPEAVLPRRVKLSKICFRADARLKRKLSKVKFVRER